MSTSVVALSDREAVARFEEATKLTLPDRAPEAWRERDPTVKENPIQYLRRVWGPYMDAGILYQDEIKRLGDPKLVQAVRTYCHKYGIDAASVLPPPRSVRTDRALAEAVPGSAESARYKATVRARYGNALSRLRQRQARRT